MLSDKLKKYRDQDYNCAETMLYAANEEYNMELDKQTLKTMAGFGGGMGVESICGAITGCIAVLSIMFTVQRGHESDRLKNLSIEFFEKFKAKFGTDNCTELKKSYKTEQDGCDLMLITAADILDEIVKHETA